jgi:hypothetical protein
MISGACEAAGVCVVVTSDLKSCRSGVEKMIEMRAMKTDERMRSFIYIEYEAGLDA